MENILTIVAIVTGVLFGGIILAILILNKKMDKSEYRQMKKLQEGTKADSFSTDIMYQKLYIRYSKTPFIKRYIYKLRRRLEIINLEDEYITRKQAAQILFKGILTAIPLTLGIIWITHTNTILMLSLILFEFFFLEVLMEGMIDKIDNNLLRQQINFFAEVRHAFHEFNMVEEAIYDVSQNDELDISRQGLKIYEILISDDPETELEKYYDIAPNSYLKEFAGVSYLTKEFGDRTIDGTSLYLRNLNNITEEMQI